MQARYEGNYVGENTAAMTAPKYLSSRMSRICFLCCRSGCRRTAMKCTAPPMGRKDCSCFSAQACVDHHRSTHASHGWVPVDQPHPRDVRWSYIGTYGTGRPGARDSWVGGRGRCLSGQAREKESLPGTRTFPAHSIPTARQKALWENVQQARLRGLSLRAIARG